jgi:hypothetical protein
MPFRQKFCGISSKNTPFGLAAPGGENGTYSSMVQNHDGRELPTVAGSMRIAPTRPIPKYSAGPFSAQPVDSTVVDEGLPRSHLSLVLIGIVVLHAFDVIPDVLWVELHLIRSEH